MKPGSRPKAKPTAQQQKAEQWFAQAMLRHRAGKPGEAEPLYREALKQHPEHFDSLHMLGVLCAQTSRPTEAIQLIEQALKLQPGDAAALNNIAGACNLQRRYAEALGYFDRLLKFQPANAEAHTSRSDALRGLGRHAEALIAAQQALQLNPALLRARIAQANALRRLNRFDEALASLDAVLAQRPDYPEALNDKGNVLFDLRRFDEALSCFERALELRPKEGDATFNRANCLRALQRHADAIAAYDALLARQPRHAEALNNRGAAFEQLGDFAAAIASYTAAQTADPEHVMAHLNAGLCHLLQGDLDKGWPLYRWRERSAEARLNDRPLTIPRWQTHLPLKGRSILLLAEQGLGDTLQFCRYAPMLAAQGARVLLEVWPPLTSLLGRLEGVSQLVTRGEPLPDVDYCLPLLDLPGLLGTRLDNIPTNTPYLAARADRITHWQAQLAQRCPGGQPRIGLVWSGNAQHSNDHNRSLALTALLPLLGDKQHFICLQPEIRDSDLPALARCPQMLDLRGELRDFDDTAALVSQLDLVISVDTSVAHLAGALGRPTWLLLPKKPDWRWLLERSDSPWYPSMRLFRQSVADDWSSVVANVKQALDQHLAAACSKTK